MPYVYAMHYHVKLSGTYLQYAVPRFMLLPAYLLEVKSRFKS